MDLLNGRYGRPSFGGPSQEEFMNMLRHYGVNTDNPQDLEEQLRKIIEIQRRSASQSREGDPMGFSQRANALENYLNYIMRGVQMPDRGAGALPDVKR